jgi:transposase
MKLSRRRLFTDEFKTEAVRRVWEDKRSPASVAKELGVPRQLLSKWLERATEVINEPTPGPLSDSERSELERLRERVRRLEEEKEILKKATAFFAREKL